MPKACKEQANKATSSLGTIDEKPSKTGRVVHDLGLLTWFGGTLFGQVSLNPAVSSISDESERGRILNEAWARFQAGNTFPECFRRCSDDA
jgi:hypothetical protein